jgi:hypothetical protein
MALSARAQQGRHYLVVSLIGDRLAIIGAQVTVGSNLDRNVRSSIGDTQGTFDRFALVAAGEAIARAEPASKVSLLSLPASRFHDEPERLFQRDGVALPGPVVDVIEKQAITHVVLLTKYAAEARFLLYQRSIGIGKLKGLGFYVDPETRLTDVSTGKDGDGFLGPFVYVRASLVDVSTAAVVREELIRATETIPTYSSATAVKPWEVLSPEQKIDRLKRMLEKEITNMIPPLIGAR